MSKSTITDPLAPHLSNIRIVLINTQHPGNIGAAARAMKNMGLSQLYLVDPQDYPADKAVWRAGNATDVLEQAVVVNTLDEAIADCGLVLGTSARERSIPWMLHTVREAGTSAVREASQHPVAILFGREDRGLTNEELAMANYHVTIPVNTDYGVLNVAQAIQVICYEMRMATLAAVESAEDEAATMPVTDTESMQWDEPLVTHEQMEQFYPHIEKMLAEIEFLDPKNPRLLPLRLRRLFGRIQLDRMEYHLLRGIFSRVQALNNGTWKKSNTDQTEDQSNA